MIVTTDNQVDERVREIRNRPYSPTVVFYATNEDLSTIVTNLEPSKGIPLSAFVGQETNPFALAQSGAKVIAVDYRQKQIDLAQLRRDLLLKKDTISAYRFLNLYPNSEIDDASFQADRRDRNQYFQDEMRLNKIRDNLGNIEFREGDIFEVMEELVGRYNKVYLSNVPIFRCGESKDSARKLSRIQQHLQHKVLVYTAWSPKITNELAHCERIEPTIPNNAKKKGSFQLFYLLPSNA